MIINKIYSSRVAFESAQKSGCTILQKGLKCSVTWKEEDVICLPKVRLKKLM